MANSDDISTSASFFSQVVHFGTLQKENNKRLWSIILKKLVKTHEYNHIVANESTKDGLPTTYYGGDTRTFTFEDYSNFSQKVEANSI